MGKIKNNNKKKQNRHNATGMETFAEVEEAQALESIPVETIQPLLTKVERHSYLLPNLSLVAFITKQPHPWWISFRILY